MGKLERRAEIVEFINEQGRISFSDLRQHFPGASEMTLRTDLKELDAQGRIIRMYGGARTIVETFKANDSFFLRATRNLDKRQQIARKAQALLKDELSRKPNVSIFMDSGVTITEISAIFPDEWCYVVTNSISVAYNLAKLKKPSVTVLGGMLNRINCSCDSMHSMDELSRMNFDMMFLPTAGFAEDVGFSCGKDVMDDMRSIAVEHSKKVIIPMDSSKVGKTFQVTHTRLSSVNLIISDDDLPPGVKQFFLDNGIEVL